MAYENELEIALRAARTAGEIIMRYYKEEVEVSIKANETPVTKADLEANVQILKVLQSASQKWAYLSEESSDDLSRLDAPYCWIIDPLDGTKEFIRHKDEFAVNIALAKDHQVVLGVIYAPVFNEMYYAVKGSGAWLISDETNNLPMPIHVSERSEQLKVLKSRSHDNPKYSALIERCSERIEEIKRVGSSYKGCLVAKGSFDVYYSYGTTSVWDIAPLEVIISEAGGFFAQGDGTPFQYNVKEVANKKGFMILNNISNRFD